VIIGGCDTDRDVFVIAEIGGNHNGDADTAYRLVEAAVQCGANAVKFQSYKAEKLVHPGLEAMPLARVRYTHQIDRFRSLELADEVYERILDMCRDAGIAFLTTPFDIDYLNWLAPVMPAIKIASGDLTFHPLVKAAAATGKPVLLSTGMADVAEIDAAAALIPQSQRVILHCVSLYPTPDSMTALSTIPFLAEHLPGTAVGYSDHTIGPEACIAAVALGARVLEKHFTLNPTQEIGDHRLSLDPAAFGDMVRQVRRTNVMLGTVEKRISTDEMKMRRMLRPGHVLTETDIECVRPETAYLPSDFGRVVGRALRRDLAAMEPIADDAF